MDEKQFAKIKDSFDLINEGAWVVVIGLILLFCLTIFSNNLELFLGQNYYENLKEINSLIKVSNSIIIIVLIIGFSYIIGGTNKINKKE